MFSIKKQLSAIGNQLCWTYESKTFACTFGPQGCCGSNRCQESLYDAKGNQRKEMRVKGRHKKARDDKWRNEKPYHNEKGILNLFT